MIFNTVTSTVVVLPFVTILKLALLLTEFKLTKEFFNVPSFPWSSEYSSSGVFGVGGIYPPPPVPPPVVGLPILSFPSPVFSTAYPLSLTVATLAPLAASTLVFAFIVKVEIYAFSASLIDASLSATTSLNFPSRTTTSSFEEVAISIFETEAPAAALIVAAPLTKIGSLNVP